MTSSHDKTKAYLAGGSRWEHLMATTVATTSFMWMRDGARMTGKRDGLRIVLVGEAVAEDRYWLHREDANMMIHEVLNALEAVVRIGGDDAGATWLDANIERARLPRTREGLLDPVGHYQ